MSVWKKWLLLGAVLCAASTTLNCSSTAAGPRVNTGGVSGTGQANTGSGGSAAPASGGAPQEASAAGKTGSSSGGQSAANRTGTGGVADAPGGTTTGGAASGGSANTGNAGKSGAGTSSGAAASGGAGVAGAGGSAVVGSAHTGVWKVMPLGDSVTGSTCYPQVLSKDLIAAGHTNFKFIGTVTNNCGNGTPSVMTEGHGGYGVTFLPSTSTRPKCTKQPQGCGSFAELQTWAAEKPDIVLMHYATNDCWDGEPVNLILSAYLAVIAEFRKQNPNVIFFVSKIIPLTPAPANAVALNAAVTPQWASTNATASSPIYIIDHWTGFNAMTDTVDGVHPNAVGAQKMSTASVSALAAAGYF